MKTRLLCPCGDYFEEEDQDALVAAVQKHLSEKHPDMDYDEEDILFLAY